MLAIEELRSDVVSNSLAEEVVSLAMSDAAVEPSSSSTVDVMDSSSSASVLVIGSSEGLSPISLLCDVAAESVSVDEGSISTVEGRAPVVAESKDVAVSVVSSLIATAVEESVTDGNDEESVSCEGGINTLEASAAMVSVLLM